MKVFRLCLFLMVASAHAAVVNVSSFGDGSGSVANATSALAAATNGDTIVFPRTSNTWSTTLTVSKQVTLSGTGCVLIAGATLNNGFFYITGITSASLMRVTGFLYKMSALNGEGIKIMDNVDLTSLRIDNNTFTNGSIPIDVGGARGVIDHNTFYNGNSGIYYTAGTRAQADASWTNMSAGTSNALFIEDNLFVCDASYSSTANNLLLDTYNGGKLVIRNNTVIATNVPAGFTGPYSTFQLHGNASGGASPPYWEANGSTRRGQSVVEMYRNTINAKRVDYLFVFRGSANLVWSNTLDTTVFNPTAYAYEEEGDSGVFSPARTNWPAEDQVHNSFFWGNTLRLNGVTNANWFSVLADSSTNFIQLNRDYFLHEPQSSGGSESFTGANGASGTYPTDGITYATQGTMTFSSSGANAFYPYTPYTYPHPLTGLPAQGGAATTYGGSTISGGVTFSGRVTVQ